MIYLVRFAHLKYPSKYKPGDIIKPDDPIGVMGNTGYSFGAHLHFDLIQCSDEDELPILVYRLAEIAEHILDNKSLAQQYKYFLDKDLFKGDFKITTYFGDPDYLDPWQFHPGYDLVPKRSKNNTIYWNRSFSGTVHMVGYDSGYGNYIVIRYEV